MKKKKKTKRSFKEFLSNVYLVLQRPELIVLPGQLASFSSLQ